MSRQLMSDTDLTSILSLNPAQADPSELSALRRRAAWPAPRLKAKEKYFQITDSPGTFRPMVPSQALLTPRNPAAIIRGTASQVCQSQADQPGQRLQPSKRPHRRVPRTGRGTDCSGFVQYIYGNSISTCPAPAPNSLRWKIMALEMNFKLMPGDLLFSSARPAHRAWHHSR
jgi:cell wall-associated NlpC family hydrolase